MTTRQKIVKVLTEKCPALTIDFTHGEIHRIYFMIERLLTGECAGFTYRKFKYLVESRTGYNWEQIKQWIMEVEG